MYEVNTPQNTFRNLSQNQALSMLVRCAKKGIYASAESFKTGEFLGQNYVVDSNGNNRINLDYV